MRYLVLVLSLVFITGCYTQKKAAKSIYKSNDVYPALTAKITRQLYPCVVKDSIVEVIVVKKDSIEYYQDKIDSLLKVKTKTKDSISLIYKDTCKSVIDNFNKGYSLGYNVGFYDGKKNCTPDTIMIRTTITLKDNGDSVYFSGIIKEKQKEISTLEKRNSTIKTWRTVWLVVAGVLTVLLLLLVYILKPKIKK